MPINTPILLTWLRIVAIPVFVAVYYLPDAWLSPVAKNWTAMSIFAQRLNGIVSVGLNADAFVNET